MATTSHSTARVTSSSSTSIPPARRRPPTAIVPVSALYLRENGPLLNFYCVDASATSASAEAGDAGALPRAAQHADVAQAPDSLWRWFLRMFGL
ncbi:hypothetical protein FIBSPDRAFT_158858 [Athelia psychrophila]|uniref:Uncharacterized protein n=1 Tax=Athelia psychrophila TaxID=1759441 RepID=A0A166STL5_9AGAM|nr:hypothetical protein FIBSPDRAFT_158858 [Fibularhizoctonia sp. CBS 109695]